MISIVGIACNSPGISNLSDLWTAINSPGSADFQPANSPGSAGFQPANLPSGLPAVSTAIARLRSGESDSINVSAGPITITLSTRKDCPVFANILSATTGDEQPFPCDADATSQLFAIAKAALAVHQKVLPPSSGKTQIPAKPWITPTFRDQTKRSRKALIAHGDHQIILEENLRADDDHTPDLLADWENEVFILGSDSQEQLLDQIDTLYAQASSPSVSLKDLAFTTNSYPHRGQWRAAIVASSKQDLCAKLLDLSASVYEDAQGCINTQSGLYYRPAHQHVDGKLAFVLPGLGAAYPNMLRELSMHFPQVRIIFDYVDFISGEQTAPSNYIFPNSNNADAALSSAMLASMDSAVVTVLLAEWALFLLLQKLQIRPDQMVGCSTGEFGALTMGGAVDVVSTAPMFYRASTRVARSVPKEQIAQLTSMKVDAGCEQIEVLIKRLDAPVYLTADLSPSHTIITGDRKTMQAVAALLEQNQISSHKLPVAIPYHTPLVKDKVTGDDPEIKELPINAPEIKAWSCSTGEPYPKDVEELRRILTALFEKPIRLRTTIDKMYDDGVRAFVELGPRGALTPLIQETLGNREHLAIAADLVNRGGISQLHHLIAALFCYGFSMDLDYLYARRAPQLVTFPEPVFESQYDPVPNYSDEGTVVANYLNTLATFHKQMLDSQQQVMLDYLVTAGGTPALPGSADLPAASSIAQPGSAGILPTSLACTIDLPFLQNASISFSEDAVVANLVLHPDRERFLLDHAIGGNTRTIPAAERVYLLPLMVAIEIMAEVASLLVPDSDVISVETVRANRRIRVEQSGCPITLIAKLSSDGAVQVSISDAAELMSCRVRFGTRPAEGLAGWKPALPGLSALPVPRITPDSLYSPSTMFHGPTMQSVTSLTGVKDKVITGIAEIKPCAGWFSDNASPQFLIDPLLLDNASQFTLYYLLEQDQNVSALLPFFIERIEFFDHPITQGAVSISADMLAAGERTTEANITICGGDQRVLQLDAMNSRRINLPDNWRAFIADPTNNVLSSHFELPFASKEKLACFKLDQQRLPQDDAALDWCTDYVLTADERAFYSSELKADHRRREWLSGRIAAKDAVRAMVKCLIDLSLAPADIEIATTESGKPEIRGSWQALLPRPISISISHTGGQAVAIGASPDYSSVGVDIQTIAERDESFEVTAFGAEERSLLDANNRDRAYGIACLWAAKEAAGKLHGFGLAQCLTDVRITNADWTRGILQASVANVMETKLSIDLFQIDNCILAVTTAPSHAQQLTS